MKSIPLLISTLLLAALHAAEPKLAAVFSDHMVVQREQAVPVWGWADPGDHLTVSFAGQEKQATADAAGKWQVKLDPMPASAEARALVVKSAGASNETRVTDVLVGEVWLGSGQSNMAMLVARAKDFDREKAAADLPQIRMFKEESGAANAPAQDAKGRWTPCSPDAVGTFSATLYFFGRELHRDLKVPVGLINSSVGGTPIEAWIAAEAQAKSPELKGAIEAQAKAQAALDTPEAKAQAKERYEKQLATWKELAAQAKAAGKPAPKKPQDPQVQRARGGGAGGLFHGKIAPLIPYAIRGVVWYQGEANANSAKAALYQHQLALLVADWRARWGAELPFAWVQLPNFKRPGDGWMRVREAMLKSLCLPRTGMAITIDIGESNNIHPANKQEVGRRLSLWALGEVYQKPVAATSGPLPAGHEVRGAEIVMSFSHGHGGLQAGDGAVQGFEIAGEDRQWQPAAARIDGDKVILSSPQVAKPVAVRYAWQDDPACNLQNRAGLPASPFRTDDW